MIFMQKKITRIFIILLCFAFISGQSGFSQSAAVVDISSYLARQHSTIAINNFRPLHLRYLQLKQNKDSFKLLIDKGNSGGISQEDPKGLFKHFLVGLALPNDKFWVNLRPDSPSQIIDPLLAETDIGRILLEADLQLKKDIAQATHPAAAEGAEYWDKLYKKAGELFSAAGGSVFGGGNITIPAVTRPWIVPDEIIIKETPDSAYIYKATLKVMLEQDYLKNDAVYNFKDERLKQLNEYSSRLIRELIIPNLTRRINTSRKYSALRQVYYSLILSQWFKARFSGKKNAYTYLIDSKDLTALTSETPYSKEDYFKAYQSSFKDGEYSYKTPVYTFFGQTIRSYFSGGVELNLENVMPTQFGGIAGVNTNGSQVCIVVSDQEQIDIKSNPYLLAAEGKISLDELVVRITGNSLSEGEIQKRIQGMEDAHRIELNDGRLLGKRNPDWTYQKDENNPYSFEGIREKAEILKESGFDRRQRRDIMEYGLAGGKDGKRDNDKKVRISYFAQLKGRLLNFIKGTPAKDSSEVKQLIEDADRQKGEKTKWSDSYVGFLSEAGAYLRAPRQENTIRWDYLKGPDQYGITKALGALSKLKLLGHGTIGFLNSEVNHDRKVPGKDIDFVAAVSLLKIILEGKMKNSSVSEFVAERKDYFKLNANYYGPFFVILQPGIQETDLGKFSKWDAWGDRYKSIGSKLHYIYLLPRDRDKEFFAKAIALAVREGIIETKKAEIAVSKLKTVAEFLEDRREYSLWQSASVEQFRQSLSLLRQSFERYRSQPIEDTFKNMSWSARFATWFNATRKIIAETHKKIVVYYPGAGNDLLYALLATDADTFIFVDKANPSGVEISNFIISHKGEILKEKQVTDIRYLKFRILGKIRELYYYSGVDAGDENKLPEILKNGYNVYIEKHFNANGYGGFTGDFNNLWRINLKYLAAKGFTITDYSLSLKEDISKSALHQIGYTQGHSPEDRSYYAGILDFNIYLPAPAVAGSPIMPQPDNALGGIDFRSLPIVSQAVNNISLNISHLSFANLTAMNLSQERQGIERLISSGISPSAERIKDYLQASCAKGEIEKDRWTLINYISAILRQEEEKCRHSETLLKDILIILEANSSSAELSRIFLGKPFNTPGL